MRRFALPVLAAAVSLQMSCYILNTERGSSWVMLAQIFPDGVTALYAAVYQGTSEESNLLAYQVFYPGQSVIMAVPGGADRVFVIWGEGSTPGIATYYGATGPVDVASDGDMEVPVAMQELATEGSGIMNPAFYPDRGYASWNRLEGATYYELQYQYRYQLVTGAWVTAWRTVYIGSDLSYSGTVTNMTNNVRVRPTSVLFNLTTDYINNL
ncbi:MAG: hypothetical protein JXA20_02350 [Spirochaetes bacterium]|nr:hypothetical protein [Spirochaetota bacterium]